MNSNPVHTQKNVREAAHKALDEVLNRMFDKQLLQKGEIFEVHIQQSTMGKTYANIPTDYYESVEAELIQRNTGEYEIEEIVFKTSLIVDTPTRKEKVYTTTVIG